MNRPSSSSGINIVPVIILAVIVIVGGILISQTAPSFFPRQGSVQSQQLDTLFQVMLALGGGLFLLVQILIYYSAIRFRVKDPNDKSDGPPIHGNNTLEIVWTAIPAVVVVILVIYSYSVFTSLQTPRDNEYTVDVVGRRFAWQFTYTAPEDVLDPATGAAVQFSDSNLYTYIGQNLLLQMTSVDVNHAFWVPEMRLKQDLLVGRTTELRFTPILATGPDEDGTYYIQHGFPLRCAELCGDGHGNMGLISHVVVFATEERYMEWFNSRVYSVQNPPEDPVLRGEQVLISGEYPCSGCHTLDSLGWTGVTGPNLNGIGDRAGRRVAGTSAEEYIITSIRHPQRFVVPGYSNALMPQFVEDNPDDRNYMPDTDAIAIAAYLCTQTESGDSACDIATIEAIAAQEVTATGTAGQ
ncbi:MAG: cytochrome c oxidase subunit II transmembrane domain-containing protein [Anaerolineae bacterium]